MPSGAPPDSNPDLPRTLRAPGGTWHDPGVTIRTLTLADLPACLALAADRDWQPEAHKWRLLIEGGEAFGIDDEDGGGLAGSVVLTRYGDALAAVGMMLVAARREGRGLGRRLMTHLLDRAGDATVFLTATPLGRPLYEKLAFRPIGTVTSHTGRFAGGPAGVSRPAVPADLPAILALDAEAYGGDRSGLLRRYLAQAERVRVVERDGRVAAYGAALRNTVTTSLGPVIGGDAGLLADLAAGHDRVVRVDLDHRFGDLIAFARGAGLEPGNSVTLMVRGAPALPGDRARVTAPMMMAVG